MKRPRFVSTMALLLIGLGLVTWGASGANGEPESRPHLRVQGGVPRLEAEGTGLVSEAPDLALATVGVTTEGPTAAEAMTKNAQITQRVVKALRDAGLTANDAVRTQVISVSPLTEGKPGERLRTVGYRASNQVEIRVTPIDLLGAALDAALKAGATEIGAQRFALSNPQQAELRALEEAVKDARVRIDTMAQALGRHVGRILMVQALDGPAFPRPESMGLARAAASIPVEPGVITVSARVRIRAELQ